MSNQNDAYKFLIERSELDPSSIRDHFHINKDMAQILTVVRRVDINICLSNIYKNNNIYDKIKNSHIDIIIDYNFINILPERCKNTHYKEGYGRVTQHKYPMFKNIDKITAPFILNILNECNETNMANFRQMFNFLSGNKATTLLHTHNKDVIIRSYAELALNVSNLNITFNPCYNVFTMQIAKEYVNKLKTQFESYFLPFGII